MHEQDDEADDGADEDDDAFVVGVRSLSRAAGEGTAEGGGGVARGAIWKDGVGGAVGVGLSGRVFEQNVVVVVVAGVKPEIPLGARCCQCTCGYEPEPQQKVARHVSARVN